MSPVLKIDSEGILLLVCVQQTYLGEWHLWGGGYEHLKRIDQDATKFHGRYSVLPSIIALLFHSGSLVSSADFH